MNKEKQKSNNSQENKKPAEQNAELKELIKSIIGDELKGAREVWEKDMEVRVNAEREDAAKLASMSAEERAKFEMDKKQKDFETERQQYVSERAEFEAAKELASQGLPVTFAGMVADADKEKMLDNISVFKAEFLKAIEAGLTERLKGGAPRISKEVPEGTDPFLSGLGM